MMVIYLPVKFEFDWSNRFRVRVRKRKMWMDRQTEARHINLIGGLVTRNPPNKTDKIITKVSKVDASGLLVTQSELLP